MTEPRRPKFLNLLETLTEKAPFLIKMGIARLYYKYDFDFLWFVGYEMTHEDDPYRRTAFNLIQKAQDHIRDPEWGNIADFNFGSKEYDLLQYLIQGMVDYGYLDLKEDDIFEATELTELLT